MVKVKVKTDQRIRQGNAPLYTSPGGQINAFKVILYATAIFLGCFRRLSAVFHEHTDIRIYGHTDKRTYGRTYGQTNGQTNPLIEMRGRI